MPVTNITYLAVLMATQPDQLQFQLRALLTLMADPLGVQALWEEYNEDNGCWFPLPLKRKFPGFEKKLSLLSRQEN